MVQLTFFRLNSYLVVRREQGYNILGSDEQYTPYVDAKIKAHVVKAKSFEIVLYDYNQGQFHVKSKRDQTHHLNLHDHKCTCGKTLIYGFPYSHIIAACQFRSIDFRSFVQATTIFNPTMIHGKPCFIPSLMNMNGLLMMVQPLCLLS